MEQQNPDIIVKEDITEPRKFKVLIHNDDYTDIGFVRKILMQFFHKTFEDSHSIAMEIHEKGLAICGVYTEEIAETKTMQVQTVSHSEGYPLKCTSELEE